MPRRGSGSMGQTSQKGGTQRRTRTPRNVYDPIYRREDWRVQPTMAAPRGPAAPLLLVVEMPRQGGNTTKSGTVKQQPKPQPKGGSKPAGTTRGK